MKKLFREAYFQSAPIHFAYMLRPGTGETAIDAGYFAIVVDVVAHHYQPFHPEYTIPPMPYEVLKWLREPYCYAKDWNLKAQKAFKEELPIYLKGKVHINA